MTFTEKGAAMGRSYSNSGEGRRFDDRQCTRGKYTQKE
jgi:hypothetical protein